MGVERHLFGIRIRPWHGGVRHQWLRSVSSNEIGNFSLEINFKYGIFYEYGSEEEKVGMETEQRTEKRARCEIIPESAQVKHSHQKYTLKNHGKIYGRRK